MLCALNQVLSFRLSWVFSMPVFSLRLLEGEGKDLRKERVGASLAAYSIYMPLRLTVFCFGNKALKRIDQDASPCNRNLTRNCY